MDLDLSDGVEKKEYKCNSAHPPDEWISNCATQFLPLSHEKVHLLCDFGLFEFYCSCKRSPSSS
jgi:hypothetical protein